MSMRWTHTLSLVVVALVVLPSLPVQAARFRALEIRGLLDSETTGEKIERKLLRKGAGGGTSYRTLDGLYVIHVPSEQDFEDLVAPALAGAIESDRPVEALRAAMFAFDDADALLSGPEAPANLTTFGLPGDRGRGFVAFAAPVLLGPDVSLLNHNEPNKIRALSGVYVEAADDEPVVESLGLMSIPEQWTSGGRVQMPKLNPLPDDGEGAWVKYKGESFDTGEELLKRSETVAKIIDREELRVDTMKVWPGASGDQEGVKDVLSSARYATRTLEVGEEPLSDLLRQDRGDWKWVDRKVKHPTRYGIATMTIAGEVDEGKGIRERADVFVYVFFYTPVFIDFEEAHLYCQTSPEFLAQSVQKGELPFFEAGGSVVFYRGHLDRWLQGVALDTTGGSVSRKSVEELVARWTQEMESSDARAIQGMAHNPSNWPLRLAERDDDEEGGKTHKIAISKQDLANWLHLLKPDFEPDYEVFEDFWTLHYQAEGAGLQMGKALAGGAMDLDLEQVAVASAPSRSGGGSAREDEARRSQDESRRSRDGDEDRDDRARMDEQRRRDEEERAAADQRRRDEARRADEERRAEESRRAEEERRREELRLAALETDEAPVEIRLRDVIVGTPVDGKPYLATKAGQSLPIKIAYSVGSAPGSHKLKVVSQAFAPDGSPVQGFAATSPEISPKEGDGSITSYLKVPSTLTKPEHMGSYLVLTRLEVDGVPAEGEREEFVHLGLPLQLHSAELDPAVVVPEDEAELLMDLQIGGWSVEEEVKLTVRMDYTVGGKTASDEFPLTRRIGFHELGIDVDVPADLPAGDGTWKVTVWEPAGNKVSKSGSLTVFSQELVQGGGRSGSRMRVDEDEDDPLAGVRTRVESEEEPTRERTYVRSDESGEAEDDWDFDDVDFDEYEESKTRGGGSSGSAGTGGRGASEDDDERAREEADTQRRDRARAEEEQARREEQDRARAEEERRQKEERDRARAEQERRQKEERDRARAEEERRQREEQERARAEEERRQKEERDRARAEEERRQREERERARAEEERRRREEEERRKEPEIGDDLFESLDEETGDDEAGDDETSGDEAGDDEDLSPGDVLDDEEDEPSSGKAGGDGKARGKGGKAGDKGKATGGDGKAKGGKAPPRGKPAADDDDDAPPRGKPAADDDDDDDTPPQGKPEADDDDTPPRGKPAADDDDDDTPPRGKPAADDDDDDASPTGKGKGRPVPADEGDDEDEEDDGETGDDETPPRGKARPKGKGRPVPADEGDDEDEEDDGEIEDDETPPRGKAGPKGKDKAAPKGKAKGDSQAKGKGKGKPSGDSDVEEPEEDPDSGSADDEAFLDGLADDAPEDEEGADGAAADEPDPADEELAEADFPPFIYWAVDEEDVQLEAESESVGILHVYGDAKKRTAIWLAEWRKAASEGAPEWLWVLHTGIGPGELVFQRYATKGQEWRTVHSMAATFDDPQAEKSARATMRKVFGGWVPAQGKVIPFDQF